MGSAGGLDGSCFDTITCAELFDVKLIIDTTELSRKGKKKDVDNVLNQIEVTYESRRLAVGDFLWVGRVHRTFGGYEFGEEIVLDFIIERKSLSDFASSIVDGRYQEQRERLKKSNLPFPFYLVEGDTYTYTSEDGRITRESLEYALAKTHILTGFNVLQTANLVSTAAMIGELHRVICGYYQKYKVSADTPRKWISFVEYSATLKRSSGFATVKDAWMQMLLRAKGMSGPKVVAFVARWPTPISFRRDLRSRILRREKVDIIATIPYSPGIGQRHLGVALAEALVDMFDY